VETAQVAGWRAGSSRAARTGASWWRSSSPDSSAA